MTLSQKEIRDLEASPFWEQCVFAIQNNEFLDVNGKKMPHAIWNMMVSKRDLTLWCNAGIKPHRRWKVSDVKYYFNIKGSKDTLLPRFMKIYNYVLPAGDEEQ